MSSALAVFVPAAVVFAASPGAGNFLAMRNGARYGTRAAIFGFSGRFASFVLLFVAVAAGLGAIIAASETALTIIKWCGVTYLAWLGAQTLWIHRRSHSDDPAASSARSPRVDTEAQARVRFGRVVRQEFLTSITNPKAVLLVTAFLPQFVVPGSSVPLQLIVLGGLYIALEFVAACGWARLGRAMSSERLTAMARCRLGRFTGVVMIGMGAWLATFSARPATG